MNFADRMALKLKEARNQARISAQEAGEAVGRSDKTIYAWENGKSEPSAEQLITLCKLYGVDITYFYSGEIDGEGGQKLTAAESNLIAVFRMLSTKNRNVLLTVAKSILEDNEKE